MKQKIVDGFKQILRAFSSFWKRCSERLLTRKTPAEKEKKPSVLTAWFQSKKNQAILSRMTVGILAVALGGLLVLWDMGVISLPFLKRQDRREPLTQETSPSTQTEEETKEEEKTEEKSPAVAVIDGLYAYDSLPNGKSLVTPLAFDAYGMTLTKQRLQDGNYRTSAGFIIKEGGESPVLFTAPDLTQLEGTDALQLTSYRDSAGNAVFQNKETEEYFRYDGALGTFVPSDFNSAKAQVAPDIPLPANYGKGDEGTTLFSENGLYGYTGSYKESWRTRTFTIPPTYPRAYAYSEGFAVMADENGRVTIRNARGEEVFSSLSLILPEKSGKEALGFHYFSGGLLRVVIATYDTDGRLTNRRESIINTKGEEITLPKGFDVIALSEGILLVKGKNRYGYLGANGAWVADPVYSAAEPFMEGVAVVTNEKGKMGMIDRSGKAMLPCAFDQVSSFSDGIALCYEKGVGWYMLVKVEGVFTTEKPEETTAPSYYTKMTITRGPQNTFDYEPDEIIELPPVLSTPSRTTHPENTVPDKEK